MKDKPWWAWHWDRKMIGPLSIAMPRTTITRWRRGSLLTVYRHENHLRVEWWFYGPFNLAIGFSWPKRRPRPPLTFAEACMRERGRVLTGAYAHCCDDWDGLPVDETTVEEFACCTCRVVDEHGRRIPRPEPKP